jgi:hypothetical protein
MMKIFSKFGRKKQVDMAALAEAVYRTVLEREAMEMKAMGIEGPPTPERTAAIRKEADLIIIRSLAAMNDNRK